MTWKWYALGMLCMATVTACAHPVTSKSELQSAPPQALAGSGRISQGAFDDVGSFYKGTQHSVDGAIRLEASAAPTH